MTRHPGWLALCLLFAVVFILGAIPAMGGPPIDQPSYGRLDSVPGPAADRIVVTFKPGVSEAAKKRVHLGRGARLIERGYGDAFDVVKVPALARDRALRGYQARPEVEAAEPDFVATKLMTPNDPYFAPYQWNLYDHGVMSGRARSYFGVQAQSAWDTTRGDRDVIVAVVDTGVAYENYGKTYKLMPDLAGTTFVQGYDFVNGDAHPNDDDGHGTHVAGTIAQATNNGLGCAGIASKASLMPVKVLGRNGTGYYSWIADGIRFAADNGADVINLSLGGSSPSSALYDAVKYAYDAGVTIVVAAGNESSTFLGYPATYDEVIAVGATRFDGQLAPYSNYGPGVDLVAPGGDMSVDQNGDRRGDGILQQTFLNTPKKVGYYFFQGTSMATPHVSAVAALVLSTHPSYTRDQVRGALLSSADDLGTPGRDDVYGYGLVDAAAAIAP